MNSKTVGTISNKSRKTKIWWIKLALSLVLSNLLFFTLFSKEQKVSSINPIPKDWVAIQVRAELLTPFQSRKKILLLHRIAAKKVEGMLENSPEASEGRFTVLVPEHQAEILLRYESWEIVPFLKTLSFYKGVKGENHEIRY